jgi:thymidine phosphorylase
VSLTKTLSVDILRLAGFPEPEQAVEEALSSGRAREKFDAMVAAQGGDVQALTDQGLHKPAATVPLRAPQGGFLTAVDAYESGMSLVTAGAGRQHQGDGIDPTAGFVLEVKIGDRVEAGDEIGRTFGSDEGNVKAAAEELQGSLGWGEEQVLPPQLIID